MRSVTSGRGSNRWTKVVNPRRWLVALLACSAFGCAAPSPASTDAEGAVAVTKDVIYGRKDGLAMTMNVFTPSNPNGAAVIFLNSGGWFSPVESFIEPGSNPPRLRSTEEIGTALAGFEEFSPHFMLDEGFTVFEVIHGSTPRFVIPEIVSDVRLAVRFIKERASEFGVSPDRLGIWGGSAGGHLALMLGLSANEVAGASDQTDRSDGGVAAVVAYFPVSDLALFVEAAPELVTQFPALDFERADYPEYSPVSFASPDDPPTLIIHGDEDTLVPLGQGELIHRALQAQGATTDLVIIEGAEHGFYDDDIGTAANAAVAWFSRHLDG